MAVTETLFGHVDSAALEKLRDEFDTMQILDAVDRLDQARYQMETLRNELLALHGMAAHILNDNFINGEKTDAENIHQLVEVVDNGAYEMIEAAEIIQTCTSAFAALDSDEALAVREGWED